MTEEEIKKIAKIMLTADGWCSSCGPALLDKLNRAFPGYEKVIELVEEQSSDIEDAYCSQDEKEVWDFGD